MRILFAAAFVLLGVLTMGASSAAVSVQGETVVAAMGPVQHEAEQSTAEAAHSDCEDGCTFCENCNNCMTSHSGAATTDLAASLPVPTGEDFSVAKHYTQRSLANYSGPYRPPRT